VPVNWEGPEEQPNDDDLEHRAGSFTKLFEHDLDTGLLTAHGVDQYDKLVEAIETNDVELLDEVQRANERPQPTCGCTLWRCEDDCDCEPSCPCKSEDPPRLWINPRASNAGAMKGGHPATIGDDFQHRFTMTEPPGVESPETAVEMLEAYLFAVCRDVDFDDYGTGSGTDSADAFAAIPEEDSITRWASNNLQAALGELAERKQGLSNTQGAADHLDIPTDDDGNITPEVLFRGQDRPGDEATGDSKTGPFHSQFLLQRLYPLFPSGCAPYVARVTGVPELDLDEVAVERYVPIAERREFGVTWEDYIAIQNGEIPREYIEEDFEDGEGRYPIRGRDLGTHVHTDGPYQEYYRAATVLLFWDFPRTPQAPYSPSSRNTAVNEADGVTFGPIDVFSLVGAVAYEAFKGAWVQKWRAYRRLRPEAYAGLVELRENRPNGTNGGFSLDGLIGSAPATDILEVVREYNSRQQDEYRYITPDSEACSLDETAATYLLGQMYPEGSPTHPAYPSGHATVAGACVTVLKAIFDDTRPITATDMRPVGINPADSTEHVFLDQGEHATDAIEQMTVASELDKLASNIAHARMFGGVHFRSDGERGLRLGEQVAIRFLQDHLCGYPEEEFVGSLRFTSRDGHRICVEPDSVEYV